MDYYLMVNGDFWIDGKLPDLIKEASELKENGFTSSGDAVTSIEICMYPFLFYFFNDED